MIHFILKKLIKISSFLWVVGLFLLPSSVLSEDKPWNYEKVQEWEGLCRTGQEQSPINIPTRFVHHSRSSRLQMHYGSSSLDLLNNGHTIVAQYRPESFVIWEGKKYRLTQFHFHSPSETHINGHKFALEAHLVHEGPDHELLVLAVLFKVGQKNSFLQKIWSHLPETGKTFKAATQIQIQDILPRKKNYFHFRGSLTTPPCTESVQWIVLGTPMTLSQGQLKTFQQFYPYNARPPQPLHGRFVEGVN